MFRQGGWFDPKPIFQNLVSSLIWVAVAGAATALGIMIWSALLGQSGPWIAIAGMAAGGTFAYGLGGLLWLHRQWMTPRLSPREQSTLAARQYEEQNQQRRLARLADTKAVLRDQIDSAPKTFVYLEVKAWMEATNALLADLRLGRLHYPLLQESHEEQNKIRFQKAIAYLRGHLATLTERDMPNF